MPDGQITSDFRKSCQAKNSREPKIFLFLRTPNQRYITPIPSRPEGRIMIATIVGRVAMDAGSADSERHESVRQRRVVLTPQCWRQVREKQASHRTTVTTSPARRGDHVISRKAIAQGMSDALRCPVCSCAHFLLPIAHETAGAARTRHSLRPLDLRGRRVSRKPRALRAARTRTYIPVSSPATGSAEWPPDDRLRRVTQYSRDANDRTDRPRRTGYPHSRV